MPEGMDQLQDELHKKEALSGDMKRFDIAMTDRADACNCTSSRPLAFNP